MFRFSVQEIAISTLVDVRGLICLGSVHKR